ncbi:MAG: MaoC family dehydratase [Bacteroidetes bacterium]|nr:MaoC family dehydratase [Bacteroidota bacterium]MCL5026675.1 MaoC family dehydratase [Chloroflexota bacterium]
MAEEERIYEFEDAQIGDASPAFVQEITADMVRKYLLGTRNELPQYADKVELARIDQAEVPIPPSMIYRIAPLRREEVMKTRGFIRPESSKKNPRSTPYTKSEIFFYAPVKVGDTITAVTRVDDKYERRESKFITFRTTATNQAGVKVGEYTYTCLWNYARGQKKPGE